MGLGRGHRSSLSRSGGRDEDGGEVLLSLHHPARGIPRSGCWWWHLPRVAISVLSEQEGTGSSPVPRCPAGSAPPLSSTHRSARKEQGLLPLWKLLDSQGCSIWTEIPLLSRQAVPQELWEAAPLSSPGSGQQLGAQGQHVTGSNGPHAASHPPKMKTRDPGGDITA